ncbi:S9 family peptidase [Ramlibacter sp. MMS24-I3-19]|uniref:S9 family peptidase n=1 Tax=Ramlibacter sp. MMS24-I3-19 TaxID=3416606 RepID=UPI003D06EB4B
MPRPFTPDDLNLHRKVTTLDCVPGVPIAAACVRSVDACEDRYTSAIWLVPLVDGKPRQMTQGPWLDQSPRWSPDGQQLAFLSPRTGSVQVHLLSIAGGEARPCGALEGGVTSLQWNPDGASVLVTSAVTVDPDLHGRPGVPAVGRGPKTPEVAWKLPYKSDGIGYLLGREIHLFRLELASGRHRQLTRGNFDVLGFAPSPDGQRIALCRTRGGRFAHRTDLWVCDAQGGAMRQLTHDLATVLQPVWSPDGRRIAFAGAPEEGGARNGLYVIEAQSGRLQRLGGEDLEVADSESLRWCDDGRGLVFVRAHRGCHHVCRIAPEGGELRTVLAGDRQFGAFATDGDHLVASIEHPSLPSEVWASDAAGRDERRLTRLNAWWDECTPVGAERRAFEVPDGGGGTERIEGWLLRSAASKAPAPLLNDVHGGPASYALLDFDTNVFWQVLCARGWTVLALNACGSASFGREFCDRLAGHWGEADLPQHVAAVRQLQHEGTCDHRVAISGKSYGGFLSAWAVGHCDVFRAAVVMAPVGNIETHYGTSDGGYYADPLYVDSAPTFDRERARALSPLQSIERSTTPVLFLQGKDDERCPKCQSEEMFVSLMRAGDTPTELVLYPGEDHHFLGEGAPSCRRDSARRIVAWVERFTRDGAGDARKLHEGAGTASVL